MDKNLPTLPDDLIAIIMMFAHEGIHPIVPLIKRYREIKDLKQQIIKLHDYLHLDRHFKCKCKKCQSSKYKKCSNYYKIFEENNKIKDKIENKITVTKLLLEYKIKEGIQLVKPIYWSPIKK